MQKQDIQKLEERVLKKDKEAIYELAKIYLHGSQGVNKNINKALDLFKQGATLGELNCIYEFAMLHLNKDTNIFNIDQGIKLLEKAADLNHLPASFQLGKIFFYGYGKNIDRIQAEKYFRLAANGEYKEAAYFCGVIWENDFIDLKRLDEAFYFYEKAAKLGSVESIYKCGYFYYIGIEDFLEIDIDKSISFLQKSSVLNHKESIKLLSKIYIEKTISLLEQNQEDETSSIVKNQIVNNVNYDLLVK